jgi:hypothetical protein
LKNFEKRRKIMRKVATLITVCFFVVIGAVSVANAQQAQFCSDTGCGNPYFVTSSNWEWQYLDRQSGQGFFFQSTEVSSGLKISPHAIMQVSSGQAKVIFLPGCIRGNTDSAQAISQLHQTGYMVEAMGTEANGGSFAGAGNYKTYAHGRILSIPSWAYNQ